MGCVVFVLTLFLLLTLMPIPIYNNNAYEGHTVTASGRVANLRYKNDKLQIYLKGISISDDTSSANQKLNKEKTAGAVCYCSADTKRPAIGSSVIVTGRFFCFEKAANPGQFDMARYYQIKGYDFSIADAKVIKEGESYSYIYEGLYMCRCAFESTIDKLYEGDTADILKAMLLGNKDYLSEDIKDIFEKAGASHLLVISGTHIGLLGLGLYKLLKRLLKSNKAAAISAFVIMILYGMMTGLQAATARAVLMFALSLIAQITGRSYDMATAIGIAAVTALIANPLYIYDAGFVLSFAAVMGAATVYPALKALIKDAGAEIGKYANGLHNSKACGRYLENFCTHSNTLAYCRKMLSKLFMQITDMCIVSLSISIFSLPFVLFYFYRFPIYSFFINLIMIPLVGVVICGGLFSIAAGMIYLPAAVIGKELASAAVQLYIFLTCNTAHIPGALRITGKPSEMKIIGYFVLLYTALLVFRGRQKAALLRLLSAAALVIFMLCPAGHEFHFFMLDVGQGDALLMYDDRGCAIVDGGSSSVKNIGKYRIIPAVLSQGISRIDMIYVSHTDEDHVNGIAEVIEQAESEGIEIKGLAMTPNSLKGEKGVWLADCAKKKGIEVYKISAGDKIKIGEMNFECIFPEEKAAGEANENSMVLSLDAAGIKILLTGDIEGEGEGELVRALQKSGKYDFYKCAHHGSKGSSSAKLLEIVQPAATLISCGKGNRYGHPHKETIERLKENGSRIYVTTECGAICITGSKEKGVKIKFMDKRG